MKIQITKRSLIIDPAPKEIKKWNKTILFKNGKP